MSKTLILDTEQSEQKIIRMAFQILEDCYDRKTIVLIGLKKRGYQLAQRLKAVIEKNSEKQIELFSIEIDKKAPESSVPKFDAVLLEKSELPWILVDDVAKSGRTLFYVFKAFQNLKLNKIRIAVLIDREQKTFPVQSDFVGYNLATTMQEHVDVEFSDAGILAYLS